MAPTTRVLLPAFLLTLLAVPARAQDLIASVATVPTASDSAPAQEAAAAPPPRALEYSDAYRTRLKIHKIASFATLPLFATEIALGQSLYDNPSDGKKGAHAAVGAGIGVLFGINTVTGVWNLIESRNDPNHRALRWTHGLLMLGADAGFVATAALAPGDEGFSQDSRGTHRAVALTSIGVASAGYLIMLFGGH